MKRLLVLRHAKSSWNEHGLSDHERPLNKRGRRAAPRMGQLLVDEDLVPDQVLCSTARRARETTERVVEAAGIAGEITYLDALYLAPPTTYFDELAALTPEVGTAMVVGHNPGLESLVSALAARAIRFPTAALAAFELEIGAWTEAPGVTARDARCIGVWLPRELE